MHFLNSACLLFTYSYWWVFVNNDRTLMIQVNRVLSEPPEFMMIDFLINWNKVNVCHQISSSDKFTFHQ